jgi:undecaprenyl-diphosphatase
VTVDLLTHYLQIILLGIIEGVTEFLPISSTGHLLIAESLGLGHEPDVFNVVIQAGAILAIIFIYWNKIIGLLTHLENPAGRNYLLKIALAFLVTSVVSLVIIKHFKLHLPETLTPVAWATLLGGFVIFLVEFLSKNLYPHDDVSWTEAVLMGLAQVLAGVFPGTSRSGATIMTGLAFGMKRPSATEFSFLLGIPTMFAASALDLWRYRQDLTHGGHQLIIDIILGFLVSMVVAFFVVKWLLRFVQSHTFNGFAIYRVILGIVLIGALSTHLLSDEGIGKPAAEPPPASASIVHQPGSTHLSSTPGDTNGPDQALLTSPTNAPVQAQPIPTLAPAAAPTTNTDSSSSATVPTAPPATNAPANFPAQ